MTKTATIMPVVTNLWKVTLVNCIAWKSGTARRFSLNLVLIQAKAKEEGRVKPTKNVSTVDALATSEQIAEPKHTSMGDLPKSAPKGKSFGNCEDELEGSQEVTIEHLLQGAAKKEETKRDQMCTRNP